MINNKPFEDKIIRLNYDLFIRTLKTFNKKAQVNVFYNNSEDPLFFIDLENNILKLQLPLRSKEENDN